MSYEIQPSIFCENCIKCGKRPVTDNTKKGWEIKCPDKNCNSKIVASFIDFEGWNRLNKPNIELVSDKKMPRSA